MKDALEAATGELKECKAKLESLRTEVANWEGQQNARRAERDKLFQVVAAMKARGAEREEPAGDGDGLGGARKLARERQVNAEWKSRVEAMRLQAVEAQIALEAKLAGVRELGVQVGHAQVQVAEKTLELMQTRYTRGRRTAGAHPEGEGGRRGEQGAAVGRSPGAVPRPPPGRAAGARGPGRQARAGAGDLARRRRWTSSGAWPTTPRPTSPGSRSCSTTDGSAGWTPSGSTTTSAGSARSATGCSATRWRSSRRGSSITRTR